MHSSLERLRQRRQSGEYEGGFTLIELLIVIVILGILAAIVVFAVQNLSSSSAQSACQSDYKTVEVATEAYKAQVGHYPAVGDNAAPAPGGTVAAAVAATPGIDDLYATQTVGANTVGPWLKDAVGNSSHYSIAVAQGTTAATATGSITVSTPSGGTSCSAAS